MLQHFEFHPSRYLTTMLLAAHGAALVALLSIMLPLWTKPTLAALLLCSLLYYLRRDAWLRMRISCIGLVLDGDGATLIRRDGMRVPCELLRDSLVTPYIIVVNVRPQYAHIVRNVIILPDSLDAESFRQLRVVLQWGNQAAP